MTRRFEPSTSTNSRNLIKDVSVQLNVTDQHSRDEEANQVQVPPDIVDDRITGDVIDNEGDNVTLTCIVKGKLNPRGVVKTTKKSRSGTKIFKKWQLLQLTSTTYDSEDEGTIQSYLIHEVDACDGETLRLYRVTSHMKTSYPQSANVCSSPLTRSQCFFAKDLLLMATVNNDFLPFSQLILKLIGRNSECLRLGSL
ncbi:hypothetical protein OUZ56_026982 [Daphnia magna]|uniref:Ig-like domain-containing protein n=1 Tax=Daphnia magna TaxID=35525 RepID=A0ABQ9ZNE8_9CRUS|nr:hypothetical protein OUZ56_026982 [Daphnia magna]